jgi:hypothetical protein
VAWTLHAIVQLLGPYAVGGASAYGMPCVMLQGPSLAVLAWCRWNTKCFALPRLRAWSFGCASHSALLQPTLGGRVEAGFPSCTAAAAAGDASL